MARATIRLLDFPVPELRITVTNGGEPAKIRQAFRTACYRKRSIVKFDTGAFFAPLLRQLAKLGLVKLTLNQVPTDYSYAIGSGERGALNLTISGKESFRGPFFRWVGSSERREYAKQRRISGSVRARRAARLAADRAAYEKQHKYSERFKFKVYTPYQRKLQAEHRQVLAEHYNKSHAASRREELKRRTGRKYKLSDFPLPHERKRLITVDFAEKPSLARLDSTGDKELDAIYRDITTNR
jgi:hypothetical protein